MSSLPASTSVEDQGFFTPSPLAHVVVAEMVREATTRTLKLRFSRYSTTCVLNFVWPALKSVPRQPAPFFSASSQSPGQTVSCDAGVDERTAFFSCGDGI